MGVLAAYPTVTLHGEGKEPATRSDRHCDAEGSRGVPRPTSRRRGVARTRERSMPGAEGSQAATRKMQLSLKEVGMLFSRYVRLLSKKLLFELISCKPQLKHHHYYP